jgi:hypothetical protein
LNTMARLTPPLTYSMHLKKVTTVSSKNCVEPKGQIRGIK